MSAQKIRVGYLENEEHYFEAAAQDPLRRSIWLMVGLPCCFGFILFGWQTLTDYRNGVHLWWIHGLIGALFVGFVLVLFGPIGQRWLLKKALRKRLANPPTQAWFEFTEAGFLSTGREGSSSHHPWTLVPRVIERPKGLLIYVEERMFFWVPKRVFSSPKDFTDLIDLILTRVKRFERVKK